MTGFATTTPAQFTRALVGEIAKAHGVTLNDIMTGNRRYAVSRARRAAIRAVHDAKPGWSYCDIGRLFGGLDHSSVIYALQKSGGTVARPKGNWSRENRERMRAANAGTHHNTNEGSSANG